jgi:hypothetical protein
MTKIIFPIGGMLLDNYTAGEVVTTPFEPSIRVQFCSEIHLLSSLENSDQPSSAGSMPQASAQVFASLGEQRPAGRQSYDFRIVLSFLAIWLSHTRGNK